MDEFEDEAPRVRLHSRSGARETILAASAALISEQGVAPLTMEEVAAACGIALPVVRHHFPTKDDLLTAVLARRDERSEVEFLAPGMSGHETLKGIVALAVRNAEDRGAVELFSTLAAGAAADETHPARDYFFARYTAVVEMFAAAFEDIEKTSGLRDGVTPALASRQMIALLDGLQIQWMLDDSVDMAAVLRAHLACQLVEPLD